MNPSLATHGQILQRTLEGASGVVEIVLSHPARLGAMQRAMWRELRAVFLRLAQDDSLRCIVVRGEGGAFCAGGDIAEYPGFRFSEPALRNFHEQDVWGALDAMLACDVPMVAAIEGACMGAGLEIASCCDIRVAAESSRFGAPIARLGFPMAPREAWLIAQAAGDATAREMLLEATVLGAAEMKARGFLQRVRPDAELMAHAHDSARRIAAQAPRAARLNKQVLRSLRGACPAPAADSYAFADSPEHREGIDAFLQKRLPAF